MWGGTRVKLSWGKAMALPQRALYPMEKRRKAESSDDHEMQAKRGGGSGQRASYPSSSFDIDEKCRTHLHRERSSGRKWKRTIHPHNDSSSRQSHHVFEPTAPTLSISCAIERRTIPSLPFFSTKIRSSITTFDSVSTLSMHHPIQHWMSSATTEAMSSTLPIQERNPKLLASLPLPRPRQHLDLSPVDDSAPCSDRSPSVETASPESQHSPSTTPYPTPPSSLSSPLRSSNPPPPSHENLHDSTPSAIYFTTPVRPSATPGATGLLWRRNCRSSMRISAK